MSNWQRKLLLNPEWDQAQDNLISTQELAKSVSVKLRALKPFKSDLDDLNDEREEIADNFEALAEDKNATQQDFNSILEDLFNWGDQRLDGDWNGKQACWVDTMRAVERVSA